MPMAFEQGAIQPFDETKDAVRGHDVASAVGQTANFAGLIVHKPKASLAKRSDVVFQTKFTNAAIRRADVWLSCGGPGDANASNAKALRAANADITFDELAEFK